MIPFTWTDIFAWALAAFFVVGFAVNTFATRMVVPEYRRWGYPGWFHFVTGGLELLVALLLLTAPTRVYGAALGALVMLAAIATVVRAREARRALPPLAALVSLTLVLWAGF